MKKIIMAVAGVIALAGFAVPQAANAEGCLRGAIAGGVVGHYAGHHGLLGAGVGCAYEHHEATKRGREDYYRRDDRR
ncbi:MAG TPA: hypothetical protein VFC56_12485 [Stellaceae bacterium]|nr:hypothetical protein [Stellaceae bacterium]